jgi:hypothetical protein
MKASSPEKQKSPKGGDTSNTPPQISHPGAPKVAWNGVEDWLEWSWGVNWGPRWEENREKFDSARYWAGKSDRGEKGESLDTVNIGGYPALVGPAGGRLGKGTKGPYMPWRFICNGLVYMLGDRADSHAKFPSLHVRADGRACLTGGAHALWEQAQLIVTMLGGKIVWERLSRVDPCLDMPGQYIGPFHRAHQKHHYIMRAKREGYDRSPGITLYIGAGQLLLRIYDKLAETSKVGDGMKRALMAYHRWGGFDPEHATRVEFQVMRAALRQRGIDTVEDYFNKRADLVKSLCTDWFRFTQGKPDRTHTTRAKTLPLWDKVLNAFLEWTGKPANLPMSPLPREACEASDLFRSALGLGLSAAVRQGKTFASEHELLHYIAMGVRDQAQRVDWQERMRKKAVEYVELNALPAEGGPR